MKHRIRQTLSLIIAFSMLLSLIPLYGAAMIDEFEGLETVEEIPFEFVLEPGDLTRELLREAVLAPQDLPSCIDPELAEARGHVNRLYLQEPDNRTVMFQNRDGSKTVYLFSHPVKGMSASTVSSFEISGTRLSFTFNNAITSRVGVTLSNFNIGYAEVAYIPGGVLTEDGVNITEDVRDWARGESTVSALAYNISGEAAAEYAASVAVPETDVAATAAAAPGITITPNDPAPLGGMTVMSISYSDLAGLMSFKNMSTNRYLAITTSSTPSLTTSVRIVASYSRWLVQYDSMRGYILCNFKDIHNTFIGRMAGQNTVTMGPKTSIDYVFGLTIVSTTDGTVTIGNNDYALNSTLSAYQRDSDDDAFPTTCEWKIYSKENVTLATSVTAPSSRRLEQKGVGFALDYTVNPSNATHYDVELYYAATNQPVERDTEVYEDDDYLYYINTPGVHTLYYKDMITGVTSGNFTMIITDEVSTIQGNYTYTISPKNAPGQYLTMELYYEEDSEGNRIYDYNADSNNIKLSPIALTNNYEEWDTLSRTFVFEWTGTTGYIVSATMPTKQYINGPNQLDFNKYDGDSYELTTLEDQNNALNYTNGVISTNDHDSTNSRFSLFPVEVVTNGVTETYYMIICGNSSSNVQALSYQASGITLSTFNAESEAQLWKITEVGVYTHLIQQNSYMSCGVATALSYTYGHSGSLDNIEGETFLDKYSNLWDSTMASATEGVDYQDLCDYLENISGNEYTTYWHSSWRTTVFPTELNESNMVIVLAEMKNLPYYPSNKEGTHFFNVIGEICGVNDMKYLLVLDCNYDNEHYGIYVLEKNHFLSCITLFFADARHLPE